MQARHYFDISNLRMKIKQLISNKLKYDKIYNKSTDYKDYNYLV